MTTVLIYILLQDDLSVFSADGMSYYFTRVRMMSSPI